MQTAKHGLAWLTTERRYRDRPEMHRLMEVDVCRGILVLMMVSYHFCFDLAFVGWAPWSIYAMQTHTIWIVWRVVTVTGFLMLVGISLVLREIANASMEAFVRRWKQVAGAALLVSLATYCFEGRYWIFFGILHFIAVSLIMGSVLLRAIRSPVVLGAAGVVAIIAGVFVSFPVFDTKVLSIIGFAVHKPLTDDYVPVFPWFGVVLIGMACARSQTGMRILASSRVARPTGLAARLAGIGRFALLIYLVHEPVMIGVLLAISRMFKY
jgi:uncharacterized membrane protein